MNEYNWMTTGGFDRDYHRVRDGSTSEVAQQETAMRQRNRILGLIADHLQRMIEHMYGTAGIPLRGLLDAGGGDI